MTAATRRRLLADLKRLHEEPVPLAAAAPVSDEDLTLWNGVIGVNMQVTHFDSITVPLHFLIDFPWDYPQSAPNIGFSFEFRYSGGAEYVMPDGRLKGKKVICLDILGNFGGIHTEWKQTVGSGWSPAYSVTTLLIQLQSVLCDVGEKMSQRERDTTYQSAMGFAERNPSAMLELLDEEDIKDLREKKHEGDRILQICGGDSALVDRAQALAVKAGFAKDEVRMEEFLNLLADVARGSASSTGSAVDAVKVDPNICCFSTGKLYTEAMLGVGVSREKNNLATAGELLSKEAFDEGLRQNTNKSAFEFFLPVWINAKHAEQSKSWCDTLSSSVKKIGQVAYGTADEISAIMEVYPRLINQLIVEMMRPDAAKSEAIATFEALCNFWRTLRWLVDGQDKLRTRICKLLSGFVKDEALRHKDVAPDLGMILVLFTVCQGLPQCPARREFVQAYADENSLRWVMWWQRSNTTPAANPVFEATKVSRDIAMFQLMVVDVVIGDVAETLPAMEATNCKLPDRLEKLQGLWRDRKSSTSSWAKYYQNLGIEPPATTTEQINAWIAQCVQRAATKGPRYGGAKGGSKGGGGGKGGSQSKGGARGGKGNAWGAQGWGARGW